jgi:hypothetical protein
MRSSQTVLRDQKLIRRLCACGINHFHIEPDDSRRAYLTLDDLLAWCAANAYMPDMEQWHGDAGLFWRVRTDPDEPWREAKTLVRALALAVIEASKERNGGGK